MSAPSLVSMAELDRDDLHDVVPVDLLDADVHSLIVRGWEVLADVVGADRQLAVAPIDERREL
ncbi:MAG TPA: hypothetical protein VKA05_01930, partial [Acidimicrobiales bacterium]|nr:hypothetical protein [Acidimicrobiales bacterium]